MLLSAIGLLAASPARSAPATSEEINGTLDPAVAAPTGARSSLEPLPGLSAVPQSKTVELLLQLQDQSTALGSDAPKSSADGSRRPVLPTAKKQEAAVAEEPNPLLQMKESILGPATLKESDSTARSRESMDAPGRTMAPQNHGSTGGASSRSGDSGSSLLTNPVVRFIRENRALTIGVSLAVLVGIWLTANFSMRR